MGHEYIQKLFPIHTSSILHGVLVCVCWFSPDPTSLSSRKLWLLTVQSQVGARTKSSVFKQKRKDLTDMETHSGPTSTPHSHYSVCNKWSQKCLDGWLPWKLTILFLMKSCLFFRQYNFNLLNIKWVQSLQLQKELTQFEWVCSL
jgi:hypothetical protein